MSAALTLLIILAVSLLVVRIGGTALRLTGMPLSAARFQSISALTGTGFTTQEAETLMHHPLRRRVLMGLMFAGHLGVVSLASTVILAVSSAEEGAVFGTIIYMIIAVMVICTIAMNETFDRFVCDLIAVILNKLGWFDEDQHLILAELPDGRQLAEHTAIQKCTVETADKDLTILSHSHVDDGVIQLNSGDSILCFGPASVHSKLRDVMKGS